MNKKLTVLLLLLSLALPSTITSTESNVVYAQSHTDDFTGTITGVGVNAPTQEQIAGFYRNKNIATAIGYHSTYSVQPDFVNHTSGMLDSTTVNHALNSLNYIRYIAGLNYNVTNNTTYAQQAQDGCYLNNFNGYMSHYPCVAGTNSTNYLSNTAVYINGKIGASSSNVGQAGGYYASSDPNFNTYPELITLSGFIIDGWMEDGDADNIYNVGHRRWCLYPKMTATGFGQISVIDAPYTENGKTYCGIQTHSAMYSVDNNGTEVIGVAWPAQNTPLNTFGETYPWSYSYGKQFSGVVSVTLTHLNNNKTYYFNSSASGSMTSNSYISVDNTTPAYGQVGCVIFDPNISYSHGDTFWVEIKDGTNVVASYPVSFFDVNLVNATSSIESPASTSVTFTYSGGVTSVSNAVVEPVIEIVEVVEVVIDTTIDVLLEEVILVEDILVIDKNEKLNFIITLRVNKQVK